MREEQQAAELSAIPEFALTAERRDPCGRLEGDPVLALDRTEWAHDEDCLRAAQDIARILLDEYGDRQLTEQTLDAARGRVATLLRDLCEKGDLYRLVGGAWCLEACRLDRMRQAVLGAMRERMAPTRDLGRAGPLSVQVYEDGIILSGTERERLDWNEAHELHAMLVDAFGGPEYAEVLRRQREKL